MRWFARDAKFYIGPVNDAEVDTLRATPALSSSGIACRAADGKVEIYLTLPDDRATRRVLSSLSFGNFGAVA